MMLNFNSVLLAGILLSAGQRTNNVVEAQDISTTMEASVPIPTTTPTSGSGPISWDDPAISDGPCIFPKEVARKTDVNMVSIKGYSTLKLGSDV